MSVAKPSAWRMRLEAQTQIKAGAGGATTIASAGVSFMQGLDPYLAFGAKLMAVLVGAATLTYYVLAIMEKIRARKK